jgi:hypothetical protein
VETYGLLVRPASEIGVNNGVPSDDVDFAISAVEQDAFQKSVEGYDLLTEIAEAKLTVQTALDLTKAPIRAMSALREKFPKAWRRGWGKNAKQLLRSIDPGLQRLGSAWLLLQYGILPVVYSIGDLQKLYEERNLKYSTERAFRRLTSDPSLPAEQDPFERVIYTTVHEQVDVRATVKVAYNLGALQRFLDGVRTQPFRTAWERIPYSFVVDWLFNVGQVITNETAIDFSTQRMGCTSIRRSRAKRYQLWDTTRDFSQINYTPPSPCDVSHVDTFINERNGVQLLREVRDDSFERRVWTRPEPRLLFDPYLSWKRWLTAAALSYRPTRNLIKRLRR